MSINELTPENEDELNGLSQSLAPQSTQEQPDPDPLDEAESAILNIGQPQSQPPPRHEATPARHGSAIMPDGFDVNANLRDLPDFRQDEFAEFEQLLDMNDWGGPDIRTRSGFFGSLANGVVESLTNTFETSAAVARKMADDGEAEDTYMESLWRGSEWFWSRAGDAFRQDEDIAGKTVMDNPELLMDSRWWGNGIGQLVPSVVLAMTGAGVGAGVAGAVAGGVRGAATKGVGFMAGQRAGLQWAAGQFGNAAVRQQASFRAASMFGREFVLRKGKSLGYGKLAGSVLAGGGLEGQGMALDVFNRGGSKKEAAVALVGMTGAVGVLNTIGLGAMSRSIRTSLLGKAGQQKLDDLLTIGATKLDKLPMGKRGLYSALAGADEALMEYLEEPTSAGLLIAVDHFIDADNRLIEEGYGELFTDSLKNIDVGILSLLPGVAGGAVSYRDSGVSKSSEAVEKAIKDASDAKREAAVTAEQTGVPVAEDMEPTPQDQQPNEPDHIYHQRIQNQMREESIDVHYRNFHADARNIEAIRGTLDKLGWTDAEGYHMTAVPSSREYDLYRSVTKKSGAIVVPFMGTGEMAGVQGFRQPSADGESSYLFVNVNRNSQSDPFSFVVMHELGHDIDAKLGDIPLVEATGAQREHMDADVQRHTATLDQLEAKMKALMEKKAPSKGGKGSVKKFREKRDKQAANLEREIAEVTSMRDAASGSHASLKASLVNLFATVVNEPERVPWLDLDTQKKWNAAYESWMEDYAGRADVLVSQDELRGKALAQDMANEMFADFFGDLGNRKEFWAHLATKADSSGYMASLKPVFERIRDLSTDESSPLFEDINTSHTELAEVARQAMYTMELMYSNEELRLLMISGMSGNEEDLERALIMLEELSYDLQASEMTAMAEATVGVFADRFEAQEAAEAARVRVVRERMEAKQDKFDHGTQRALTQWREWLADFESKYKITPTDDNPFFIEERRAELVNLAGVSSPVRLAEAHDTVRSRKSLKMYNMLQASVANAPAREVLGSYANDNEAYAAIKSFVGMTQDELINSVESFVKHPSNARMSMHTGETYAQFLGRADEMVAFVRSNADTPVQVKHTDGSTKVYTLSEAFAEHALLGAGGSGAWQSFIDGGMITAAEALKVYEFTLDSGLSSEPEAKPFTEQADYELRLTKAQLKLIDPAMLDFELTGEQDLTQTQMQQVHVALERTWEGLTNPAQRRSISNLIDSMVEVIDSIDPLAREVNLHLTKLQAQFFKDTGHRLKEGENPLTLTRAQQIVDDGQARLDEQRESFDASVAPPLDFKNLPPIRRIGKAEAADTFGSDRGGNVVPTSLGVDVLILTEDLNVPTDRLGELSHGDTVQEDGFRVVFTKDIGLPDMLQIGDRSEIVNSLRTDAHTMLNNSTGANGEKTFSKRALKKVDQLKTVAEGGETEQERKRRFKEMSRVQSVQKKLDKLDSLIGELETERANLKMPETPTDTTDTQFPPKIITTRDRFETRVRQLFIQAGHEYDGDTQRPSNTMSAEAKADLEAIRRRVAYEMVSSNGQMKRLVNSEPFNRYRGYGLDRQLALSVSGGDPKINPATHKRIKENTHRDPLYHERIIKGIAPQRVDGESEAEYAQRSKEAEKNWHLLIGRAIMHSKLYFDLHRNIELTEAYWHGVQPNSQEFIEFAKERDIDMFNDALASGMLEDQAAEAVFVAEKNKFYASMGRKNPDMRDEDNNVERAIEDVAGQMVGAHGLFDPNGLTERVDIPQQEIGRASNDQRTHYLRQPNLEQRFPTPVQTAGPTKGMPSYLQFSVKSASQNLDTKGTLPGESDVYAYLVQRQEAGVLSQQESQMLSNLVGAKARRLGASEIRVEEGEVFYVFNDDTGAEILSLADPIIYDELGDAVSLEERFSDAEPDIQFSTNRKRKKSKKKALEAVPVALPKTKVFDPMNVLHNSEYAKTVATMMAKVPTNRKARKKNKQIIERVNGVIDSLGSLYDLRDTDNMKFMSRMYAGMKWLGNRPDFNGLNAPELLDIAVNGRTKNGVKSGDLKGFGESSKQDLLNILSEPDPEQAIKKVVEMRNDKRFRKSGSPTPMWIEPIGDAAKGPFRLTQSLSKVDKANIKAAVPPMLLDPKDTEWIGFEESLNRVIDNQVAEVPDAEASPEAYNYFINNLIGIARESHLMRKSDAMQGWKASLRQIKSGRFAWSDLGKYLGDTSIYPLWDYVFKGHRRATDEVAQLVDELEATMHKPTAKKRKGSKSWRDSVKRSGFMKGLISSMPAINDAMIGYITVAGQKADVVHADWLNPLTQKWEQNVTAGHIRSQMAEVIESTMNDIRQGTNAKGPLRKMMQKQAGKILLEAEGSVTAKDFEKLADAMGEMLGGTVATRVRSLQVKRMGAWWNTNKDQYTTLAAEARRILQGRGQNMAEFEEGLESIRRYRSLQGQLTFLKTKGKENGPTYAKVQAKMNAMGAVNVRIENMLLEEDTLTAFQKLDNQRTALLPLFVQTDAEGGTSLKRVPFEEIMSLYSIYETDMNANRGPSRFQEELSKQEFGTREAYWMSANVEKMNMMDLSAMKNAELNLDKSWAGTDFDDVDVPSIINSRTGLVDYKRGNVLANIRGHMKSVIVRDENFEAINELRKKVREAGEDKNIDRYLMEAFDGNLKEMYGVPQDDSTMISRGLARANNFFWTAYPLSLSRVAWFNARNIGLQGMPYGPMNQMFELKDLAVAYKRVFKHVGKARLNKAKFMEDVKAGRVPVRGVVNAMLLGRSDIAESQQMHDEAFRQQDSLPMNTPNQRAFNAILGVHLNEFTSGALTWGDWYNRLTVYSVGWEVGEQYVKKFIGGGITFDKMVKRLKFNQLESTQRSHLTSEWAKAERLHRETGDVNAFDSWLHQFAAIKNENVNYVYSTQGRAIVEHSRSARPVVGIFTYARGTWERVLNLGVGQVKEGIRDLQVNGRLDREGWEKVAEGMNVLGKHFVGHVIATTVGAAVIGQKDDFGGEDDEFAQTYGPLTSLGYTPISPGFSVAGDIARNGFASVKALFESDPDEFKKRVSMTGNRMLWFVPMMQDLTNIMESSGNTQGLKNVETLQAFFDSELSTLDFGERTERSLKSMIQHVLFNTAEKADDRAFNEMWIDAMQLPPEMAKKMKGEL